MLASLTCALWVPKGTALVEGLQAAAEGSAPFPRCAQVSSPYPAPPPQHLYLTAGHRCIQGPNARDKPAPKGVVMAGRLYSRGQMQAGPVARHGEASH